MMSRDRSDTAALRPTSRWLKIALAFISVGLTVTIWNCMQGRLPVLVTDREKSFMQYYMTAGQAVSDMMEEMTEAKDPALKSAKLKSSGSTTRMDGTDAYILAGYRSGDKLIAEARLRYIATGARWQYADGFFAMGDKRWPLAAEDLPQPLRSSK